MSTRTDKIDEAIAAGAELVGKLRELGPLNALQAGLLIDGNVRAAVPNAEQFEILERARAIADDLKPALSIPRATVKKERRKKAQ